MTDSNGNRILRIVKRDATEMAEVETTEKIIQVIIILLEYEAKVVFMTRNYRNKQKCNSEGFDNFLH